MIQFKLRSVACVLVMTAMIGGCSIKPIASGPDHRAQILKTPAPASIRAAVAESEIEPSVLTDDNTGKAQPLPITKTGKTGRLDSSQMTETSGLSTSASYPGMMYAINDGGNAPTLFAIDESGQLLAQWNVNVDNRDWEDMTRIRLAEETYLIIGDTGDNLRVHDTAVLHFLREPEYPASSDNLVPEYSIAYRYDDGPRNIEAFAAIGNSLYMLSKEPLSAAGHSPHRLYQLDLPDDLSALKNSTILTARFVGTMPSRATGLEAKLAAALAGVDLSHPTAMEFDAAANVAYVLTYREVLLVRRKRSQSWPDAFSKPAKRVLSHNLAQAEALTISPGRAIWFTSEKAGAPLWAIPLNPPL